MYPIFTKQETFDIVARHLLTQNQMAVDRGTCAYRAGDLRCAAGALIPDDEYTIEMEGYAASNLCSKYAFATWYGHDIELVKQLQNIHDRAVESEWHNQLGYLARGESLVFTP